MRDDTNEWECDEDCGSMLDLGRLLLVMAIMSAVWFAVGVAVGRWSA